MRTWVKGLIVTFGIIIVGGSTALFYGLPALINSDYAIKKYEEFLSQKTGYPVLISGFNFQIANDLSLKLDVKKVLCLNNRDEKIIDVDKLALDTKRLSIKPDSLTLNSAYIDISKMKDILKNKKKQKSNFKFNIDYYPIVNINKIFVKIDNNTNFAIDNFKSIKKDDTVISTFLAVVKTPYTKTPVYIGRQGSLYYSDNLTYKDISVDLENARFNLSGNLKKVKVSANSLPAGELAKNFLYMYKYRHPNKKNFLENFYNLSGKIDVNLNIDKDGLHGLCKTHNLKGEFFDYKFPVAIPNAKIYFKNKQMYAKTIGSFAGDKVTTDIKLNEIATPYLIVDGRVWGNLTKNTTQKYFKPVQIVGKVGAKVHYHIKNEKVTVNYQMLIKPENDLTTKFGNLSNTDKTRQFLMTTYKDGGTIYLKKISYGFLNKNNFEEIILGNGLCKQKGRKYPIQTLTIRTNNTVPIYIFKGFLRKFKKSGFINFDLSYNFINNNLLGYFRASQLTPRDYLYIDSLNLHIGERIADLIMNGTFFGSPITLTSEITKTIKNGIVVKNININLDKYKFIVHQHSDKPTSLADIKEKAKKIHRKHPHHFGHNLMIEKGHLHVGKIEHSKFTLNNVNILGNLKNEIVNFEIPEISYANGQLIGSGTYDIYKHDADIHFAASDIDSGYVARTMFNLQDAIEGSAYATMHLKTKNTLDYIWADSTFALKDGYFPKIGSKEFIISRSKKQNKLQQMTSEQIEKVKKPIKFTLSKITNLDFENKQNFRANIKGSFLLDNDKLKNVEIYTKNDYISSYIEGDYDLSTEDANITVWGRNSKRTLQDIKIFKIPLSWLYRIFFKKEKSLDISMDKINKIPPIIKRKGKEVLFKVQINGNLNNNDVKVQLKDLK